MLNTGVPTALECRGLMATLINDLYHIGAVDLASRQLAYCSSEFAWNFQQTHQSDCLELLLRKCPYFKGLMLDLDTRYTRKMFDVLCSPLYVPWPGCCCSVQELASHLVQTPV